MNVKEAIKAIRVALGSNTADTTVELEAKENVEVVEHNHASATLVDGTEVYTEGELEVGAILKVKTETGEEILAPEGKHQTSDDMIVTVGEAGKIEAIEEVVAESVEEAATEEVVEEEMAEEVVEEETSEEPEEEAFNADELLAAIAALIQEYKEASTKEMEEVKEELSVLTERFNVVADSPAAETVKKSFFEEAKAAKVVTDARLDRLAAIRRGK